jgi:hypothetical protein
MKSLIFVLTAITLSACGGAAGSGGTNYPVPVPTNPYASLADGVHVLSFTCSNTRTPELSNNASMRSLRGIVGSADRGTYTNPSAALCSLKVVSIKSHAGRPYDVIITSGTPTAVLNGHAWPYASFPLCVGTSDLTPTATCVNVANPQTGVDGVATIQIAIDYSRTWDGVVNLKSSLKHNEDGNAYTGTNQEFAIISGMNQTWVNHDGSTCSDAASGSCSGGAYPGYMNLIAPTDFNCQALSGYGQVFSYDDPICQPL